VSRRWRFLRWPITNPTIGDFIVVEYRVERPLDGLRSGTLTLVTHGNPDGDITEFIGATVRLVKS
jgi:hypothetical protein